MFANLDGAYKFIDHKQPTHIEILPNVTYFLKLNIPQLTESPIVLKLSKFDEDGIITPIEELDVYHSSEFNMPSKEDRCPYLKNPQKIVIFEKERKINYPTASSHYFSLISSLEKIQTIIIRCNIKLPLLPDSEQA